MPVFWEFLCPLFFFFPLNPYLQVFFTGKAREDEQSCFSIIKHFSVKAWKKQVSTTATKQDETEEQLPVF